MLDTQAYSRLVGDIYDCIAAPDRWSGALQGLCGQFDAMFATLAVLDPLRNESRFGAYCGDPAVVVPLVTTYAAEMPFYRVLPRMELDVPLNVELFCGLDGPGAMERMLNSRMAREWAIPNGVWDGVILAVMKSRDRVGIFTYNKAVDRGFIGQEELSDMALIAPHIRRAVTISDLFEQTNREREAYRTVIDALDHAVIIVSPAMRLLYANAAAESLVREAQILRTVSGAVVFSRPQSHGAIQHAVATGLKSEIALGTLGIGVPLNPAGNAAAAHVLPLARRDATARLHSDAAAAIFIAVAGQSPPPAMDAIAALFGLTAAEKRVASMIASGKSRSEIATSVGVSETTVKTQMDNIFAKTGTNSQRGVEQLIHELTPPLRGGEPG